MKILIVPLKYDIHRQYDNSKEMHQLNSEKKNDTEWCGSTWNEKWKQLDIFLYSQNLQ